MPGHYDWGFDPESQPYHVIKKKGMYHTANVSVVNFLCGNLKAKNSFHIVAVDFIGTSMVCRLKNFGLFGYSLYG